MAELKVQEYVVFEDIKHMDENGEEFWLARELQVALGYTEWRNFSKAVDRAMLSCQNSGYIVDDQFVEVNKLIEHGKGGKRNLVDYKLTRYACYLIVQNGDPRKEVIALGQTYFAINQTGGTMPENMQTPKCSITEIEREQLNKMKKSKTKMLDE